MSESLCFVLTLMLTACFVEPTLEEFVYPRILKARSKNGEKMLHIRDGLTLSLERTNIFSENFIFTNGDNMNYSNSSNVKEIEESVYQDRKHDSSVVVQESNGQVQVRGILTDTLSIEPVLSNPRSKDGITPHVISKFNYTSIPMYADYDDITSFTKRKTGGNIHRVGRQYLGNLPGTVVIETRIVYDDALHQQRGSYITQYFAMLMSQVNKLYTALHNPRPHFVIVGIHKLMSEAYLELTPERHLAVCNSIKPLNYFVSRSWRPDAQDVVVFVSGLPHSVQHEKKGCTFPCGICSYRKVTVQSVEGLDDATSALLIAHELGHQLGMAHEGEGAGNGGLSCGPNAGLVMAPQIMNMPGRPLFSHCVYNQMKNCLIHKDQSCFAQTAGRRPY